MVMMVMMDMQEDDHITRGTAFEQSSAQSHHVVCLEWPKKRAKFGDNIGAFKGDQDSVRSARRGVSQLLPAR